MKLLVAPAVVAALALTIVAQPALAVAGAAVTAYGTADYEYYRLTTGECRTVSYVSFSVDLTTGALAFAFPGDADCPGDLGRGLPEACTQLANNTIACNVDAERYWTRIWLEDDGDFLFKYSYTEADRPLYWLNGTLTVA